MTSQNVNGDNLYNGNIKEMSTALTKPNGTGPSVPVELIVNHYRYDQLNRITSSNSFTGTSTTSYASLSNSNEYQNTFTYDANGNIQTQFRNGNNTAGASMDDLTYYYWNSAHTGTYSMNADGSVPVNATNQLAYVDDAGTAGNYSDDLEAQAAGNYTYDAIGQLIGDTIEEIGTIDWNLYGKIKSVNRTSGSLKKELNFEYDAMGQRVMKLAKERDGSGIEKQDHWAYTYYVRDAQGNVMATYKRTFNELSGTQVTDKLALDETHLYGSSRIGLRDRSQDGIYTDVTYNYTAMNTDKSYHTTTTASTTHMAAVNTATPERKLGYKAYELVNHLGNVLETVSDRKLSTGQTNALNNTFASGTDSWIPDVATVTHDATDLRLKISATSANAGTVKTITTSAWTNYTESFTLDVNGYGVDVYAYDVSSATLIGKLENLDADGTYSLTFTAMGASTQLRFYTHAVASSGNTIFYLDDIVLGDENKVEHYAADVVSCGDYYAFGSNMPGRTGSSSTQYRYGMNSQEKDPEIAEGIYTAEFWEYDSRLGRRWNTDPVVKYHESPYACFSNSPGRIADVHGDDGEDLITISDQGCGTAPAPTSGLAEYGTAGTPVNSTQQRYNGTGNVMIVLMDNNTQRLNPSENGFEGTSWDYVFVSNITEAVTWLDNTYGKDGLRINNLAINTHTADHPGPGSDIHLYDYDMYKGDQYYLGPEAINRYNVVQDGGAIEAGYEKEYEQVKAFASIAGYLNNGASVVINTCCFGNYANANAMVYNLMCGQQKNLQMYFSKDEVYRFSIAPGNMLSYDGMNANIVFPEQNYAGWSLYWHDPVSSQTITIPVSNVLISSQGVFVPKYTPLKRIGGTPPCSVPLPNNH